LDEQRFLNCICEGEAPHAILIAGLPGSGRAALARRAAAVYCAGIDDPALLTNSPHYRELSGEAVGVEAVRELMKDAAMQGFNAQRRAFVLLNAHRMSQQAQNALLKIFEEPPADTLLLLSGNEEGLLPTVRSRCMILRLGARPVAAVEAALSAAGATADTARLAAALSDGVIGLAENFAGEDYLRFRQEALSLLEAALFDPSPFAEAAALITTMGGEDEGAGSAEPKKRGKRPDTGLARTLLEIWQSLARDALLTKLGAAEEIKNIDATTLIGRMAARFTSAQIQGIIEMLGMALKRLYAKANPRMTLDLVLARLHMKEITAT